MAAAEKNQRSFVSSEFVLSPMSDTREPAVGTPEPGPKKDIRFWLAFLSMCLAAFVSSMDGLIITTALPTITQEIGGEGQYVWIANCYLVASTAIQPFCGQISNIFGRRYPMIVSMGFFALGSGIAGGAGNVAMLIGGRTVQGLGAGGIIMLIDLICCDLVPLRERSKYLGIALSTSALGTILGPLIGGAIVTGASWRWTFYINLPISGLTLAIMVACLRLTYKRSPTWKHALARIDYLGNAIFITSITSFLFGLIMGGTVYPWSSWRTILPICLGVGGWVLFHIHQASPIFKEPTMPPRLFTNRTSSTAFFLVFIGSMVLEWTVYVLPVYFQALLGASPLGSGINMLPLNAFMIPSAAAAGALLSKFGKYKPFHWVGFALLAVSCGLFSILDSTSTKVEWVFFQIIAATGIGFPLTTTLPAIQAALAESDTATSTGTYAFVRSFGFIWGITVPSVVFNSRIDAGLSTISDPDVRAQLAGGGAYAYAPSVSALAPPTRAETLSVYTSALKVVWQVALAFSLLGFVAVFAQKHIEMRTTLDTDFGLDTKEKRRATEFDDDDDDAERKGGLDHPARDDRDHAEAGDTGIPAKTSVAPT